MLAGTPAPAATPPPRGRRPSGGRRDRGARRRGGAQRAAGLVASFTQTVESAGLPRLRSRRDGLPPETGRMRWNTTCRGASSRSPTAGELRLSPRGPAVLVAPLDLQGTRSGVGLLLNKVDLVGRSRSAGGRERLRTPPLLLKPRAPRPSTTLCSSSPARSPGARADDHRAAGSRVTYRFDRVRRVDTLDEKLFRFEAPPGRGRGAGAAVKQRGRARADLRLETCNGADQGARSHAFRPPEDVVASENSFDMSRRSICRRSTTHPAGPQGDPAALRFQGSISDIRREKEIVHLWRTTSTSCAR